MKYFIGKNPDFVVTWEFADQCYRVFKSGKFIIKAYKFSDVKSYLN